MLRNPPNAKPEPVIVYFKKHKMTETPKSLYPRLTNPIQQDWVINLAERLVSDGIDVIIDKWYLKEGQDKYNFMETMVKSPDISRVLIILDKNTRKSRKNRCRNGNTIIS